VTVDEVTGGDPIENVNYTTFSFTPANTTDGFRYYRLTLTSMKGTGWNQLAEFHVVAGPAIVSYSLTLKEGTEDADKWTIEPNPAQAGQTVTATYEGALKVKSVKAKKKAAETTVTWTTAEMNGSFYAQDDWEYNNSHYGITVTASSISGPGSGGWSQNNIGVNAEYTFTFTSTVGNIKSIVITADNINIDEWSAPSGWTINNPWESPRTLSWNGTASTSVNLTLSEGQNFSEISTIVFTLE
jgi:hypothetical protein